jgi:hypothetical protein
MGGFQLATVEKCLEEAETGNLAGKRFVSLEEMVNVAGIRPRVPFRGHFTRKWLSEVRTKCRLGVI